MSFDEQPDAPLHGECAEEIARLERELADAIHDIQRLVSTCTTETNRAEKAEAALAEANKRICQLQNDLLESKR